MRKKVFSFVAALLLMSSSINTKASTMFIEESCHEHASYIAFSLWNGGYMTLEESFDHYLVVMDSCEAME